MSAETIAKQIRVEYGNIGPSSRTITRYVNEYKLVGLAPLKVGRKSKKNVSTTKTTTVLDQPIATQHLNPHPYDF